MNKGLATVELQRARWRRAREPLRLVDPDADDFATGGLAGFVEDVGVRMLILPSDPEAHVVDFDSEFWDWWMQPRPNPFGETAPTNWGDRRVPTAAAAVRCEYYNSKWKRNQYLALHRSGGLEFGLGEYGIWKWVRAGAEEPSRVFALTTIVGRLWVAFGLYQEVLAKYDAIEASRPRQGVGKITCRGRGSQSMGKESREQRPKLSNPLA